ncbi:MAG: glycosyltransferase family 4 protein [Acidobacteriota bacterium]
MEVIPTVVDLDRYSVRPAPPRNYKMVGWIGAPATVRYLELVAEAMKVISQEIAVQLRVIGANFSVAGVQTEIRRWTQESEVAEIQDIDVGIMPLTDSPWERGKCGYKLVQYMACGKPVIASPVGINKEMVRPAINGFLAKDTGEWIAALRILLADADLRRSMGAEGRTVVEQKYNLQVTTPRLAQLFHQVLTRESV